MAERGPSGTGHDTACPECGTPGAAYGTHVCYAGSVVSRPAGPRVTEAAPARSREIYGYPTVTFEETDEQREVVGDCKVCVSGHEVYGCEVVSPSGIAHIGMTGGDTKCGKNATGDGWWWPL